MRLQSSRSNQRPRPLTKFVLMTQTDDTPPHRGHEKGCNSRLWGWQGSLPCRAEMAGESTGDQPGGWGWELGGGLPSEPAEHSLHSVTPTSLPLAPVRGALFSACAGVGKGKRQGGTAKLSAVRHQKQGQTMCPAGLVGEHEALTGPGCLHTSSPC